MQLIQAALDRKHAAHVMGGVAFYQPQLVKARAVATKLRNR